MDAVKHLHVNIRKSKKNIDHQGHYKNNNSGDCQPQRHPTDPRFDGSSRYDSGLSVGCHIMRNAGEFSSFGLLFCSPMPLNTRLTLLTELGKNYSLLKSSHQIFISMIRNIDFVGIVL